MEQSSFEYGKYYIHSCDNKFAWPSLQPPYRGSTVCNQRRLPYPAVTRLIHYTTPYYSFFKTRLMASEILRSDSLSYVRRQHHETLRVIKFVGDVHRSRPIFRSSAVYSSDHCQTTTRRLLYPCSIHPTGMLARTASEIIWKRRSYRRRS